MNEIEGLLINFVELVLDDDHGIDEDHYMILHDFVDRHYGSDNHKELCDRILKIGAKVKGQNGRIYLP